MEVEFTLYITTCLLVLAGAFLWVFAVVQGEQNPRLYQGAIGVTTALIMLIGLQIYMYWEGVKRKARVVVDTAKKVAPIFLTISVVSWMFAITLS